MSQPIHNPNGDFCQIQNYVLQLAAEKKITASAYVLYAFYMSVNGYEKIEMGYEYITANTGLSHGNISKCNRLLRQNKLISIYGNGVNVNYEIRIKDPRKLPRRKLIPVERGEKPKVSVSGDDSGVSPSESSSGSPGETPESHSEAEGLSGSPSDPTYIESKEILETKNTTTGAGDPNFAGAPSARGGESGGVAAPGGAPSTPLTAEHQLFLDTFCSHWCKRYDTKNYLKDDLSKVLEIADPAEAIKYIPVLWSLGKRTNGFPRAITRSQSS